jgi:hypothetical protein
VRVLANMISIMLETTGITAWHPPHMWARPLTSACKLEGYRRQY